MYKLIQVAIGCRDPRTWVTASAELTYSSSHSLRAWHTAISVIDICLEWRHHVTGGVMWPCSGVVSSARCNYNADLAVQPLELCRPRPSGYCKISQLLTTDHTMTGFTAAATILYQPRRTRAAWRTGAVLSHGQLVSVMKKLLEVLDLSSPLTQHGIYKPDSGACGRPVCISRREVP